MRSASSVEKRTPSYEWKSFVVRRADSSRCSLCSRGVSRADAARLPRATLPRVGVVDVLTRTVGDYGIIEGDILAMQVRLRPACRPALSAPRPVARVAAESGVCWCCAESYG